MNPPECDLSLFAGLSSTIGMDLTGWDASWGDAAQHDPQPHPAADTLALLLCEQPPPPQITVQPQSQTASLGSTVSFSVQAQGSAPLSYCWYKNGLPLTEDTRITGSASSTLSIASVQSSDAGQLIPRASATRLVLWAAPARR